MPEPVLIFVASVAAGALVACSWWPALDHLRNTDRGVAGTLRGEVVASGMDPAPLAGQLLAWRGFAAGLFLVCWALLDMPPVAVVLTGLAYVAAPWWVRSRVAAYRRRVNEQVAAVARNLAGRIRVGLSLGEALAATSRDAPSPFGDHLRRTARDVEHGLGVREALGALKARVRVESVAAMAVALQVYEQRGGKLVDLLDRIAHAADEIARVERKRDTDTAAGRMMIALMAGFPVVFLALLYSLDPAMLGVLTRTETGQWVLAAVALTVYASVRWGSRILARVR